MSDDAICPKSPWKKGHQYSQMTHKCIYCGKTEEEVLAEKRRAETRQIVQELEPESGEISLRQREEKEKPAFDLKGAFTGKTLDGVIEAAKVTPLDQFTHEAAVDRKQKVKETVEAALADEIDDIKEYQEGVAAASKAQLYGVAVVLQDIQHDEEEHRDKLKVLLSTIKWTEI